MSLLDNPEQLRNRVIWDGFPHHHSARVLSALGLVPPSKEGAEVECRASHQRLLQVLPVYIEIHTMAQMMAEALVRFILSGAEADTSLGPSFEASLVTTYQHVFRTGATVALANLLDAGVITYTESDE